MAGPKRWAWKNQRALKHNYYSNFTQNFLIGFMLTWPLGVVVGRWVKSTSMGTPLVPLNRFKHDFINLDPSVHARKLFRRSFFATCCVGGIAFAYSTINTNFLRDDWYSRPDLRPFPAMVPRDHLDPSERLVFESHYVRYRNEKAKENRKNKTWYRILFPLEARYDTDQNPYHGTHKENVYNPANSYYSRIGNVHFRNHLNE